MFAWRKYPADTQPVKEQVPIPKAPANGFLVKIHAAGGETFSTHDYALLQMQNFPPHFNDSFTLGHEGCGEIVDIGRDVKDGHFKAGDLVAVLAVPGCGDEQSCVDCSIGNPQLCRISPCLGLGQDGSFAQYVAVPYRAVTLVPEGVTAAQAAIATDACLTAYHAVKVRGAVRGGQTVLIFGLGGLGFNALQTLLATKARVIVVETKEAVLRDAIELGVPKEDVVPVGKDVVEFVQDRGLVIDTVLDFVGMNQTSQASQKLVRTGGTIVAIGLLGPELILDNILCCRKRLTISYSYGGTMADLVEVLKLIQKKELVPVVDAKTMDQFPQVIHDLHEGKYKGRIVLVPSDSWIA